MNKLTKETTIEKRQQIYNTFYQASREGDIKKIYELYQEGNYPKNSILIGIPLELSCNGSIGEGAKEYFKSIVDSNAAKKSDKPVFLIPLNSFYSERIGNDFTREDLKKNLRKLIRKDIEKLDAIVIPGDNFNFPPIDSTKDTYEAILDYQGKKDYTINQTIYGVSSKDFYEKYPEHKINPNVDALVYESQLVKELMNTDKIVMSSCHGTQMYAVMNGAKMLAGIEGHNNKEAQYTEIKPNSMAYNYIGKADERALHIHKLALNPTNMPLSLEVVGKCNGVVEIIEETSSGRPYYGFQIHPEFIRNHPAIENFVAATIQRNKKQEMLQKILSNKSTSNILREF
jgi:GMP synthase-like glutamine amidotransferase